MTANIGSRQARHLRLLASGSMLVSGGTAKDWGALLHKGLVTALDYKPEAKGRNYCNGIRITPDGLRALARRWDAYGMPEIGRRS